MQDICAKEAAARLYFVMEARVRVRYSMSGIIISVHTAFLSHAVTREQ